MGRGPEPYSSARPSLEYLTHRGPYEVVAGELDQIGLPGLVFAPETGPRRPAVIFGHGYLQPVRRYANTLRFLASWGFVTAAPATERGPVPSAAGLALDMARVADRLAEAKLHRGRVTVDRKRLAVAGHGIGGGAAVLAAASGAPPVQATVTLCAAPTSPSAVAAAAGIRTPALHLIAASDPLVDATAGGAALARAWGGEAQLRAIKRARHLDPAEGPHLTSRLLAHRGSAAARRTMRMMMTAFLLLHVAGQEQLAEELAGRIAGTTLLDRRADTLSVT